LKLAYIAGAYTGNSTYKIRNNIRRAEMVSEWAWSNGIAAITPHTNTAFLDGLCDYHIWAEGYLEIIKRTKFDMMFLVPGWESSKGTKKEIEEAQKLGIPIYLWYRSADGNVWTEEYK
jgi:hypothetical protein